MAATKPRGMKISVDQLDRIIELRSRGVSVRETARLVGVNRNTVDFRYNEWLDQEAEARAARLHAIRTHYVNQLEGIAARALTAPDVPADEDEGDATPDPRMLAEAIKALSAAAKLQGLEAATKLEHSGPNGGPVEVASPVDRLAEFLTKVAPPASDPT